MKLVLSAFARPIKTQLEEQGYTITEAQAVIFNGHIQAMLRLRANDYFTDAQYSRIWTKMAKRIEQTAKPMKKATA